MATAFTVGASDALTKQALAASRVQTVAWVRLGWACPFLIPLLFFSSPPHSPFIFWSSVFFALPLEVAATLAFHTALQISPLSKSIPYLAFTPVFLLGIGLFLFHGTLNVYGLSGVLLVTCGALFLQVQEEGPSRFNFIRRIAFDRGAYLMLLVAFLYALTSALVKRAIMASSPMFFSGIYFPLVALALLPFQLGSKSWVRELFERPRLFVSIGVLEALSCVLQFQAFYYAEAAYVISVKRLSLLFAVLYGRVLFKEKQPYVRAFGALLMIAGAALMART